MCVQGSEDPAPMRGGTPKTQEKPSVNDGQHVIYHFLSSHERTGASGCLHQQVLAAECIHLAVISWIGASAGEGASCLRGRYSGDI